MKETLLFELYDHLLWVSEAMNRKVSMLAQQQGFSATELKIVMDIITHPNSCLNSVCQRTGMKKSLVSKTINQLVKQEIVSRVIDPTNRRKVNLQVVNEAVLSSVCKTTTLNQTFDGSVNYDDQQLQAIINSLKEVLALLNENEYILKEEEL